MTLIDTRSEVTSADLLEGIEAARRVAAKFARRTNQWHRLDDYVGAALEAVAKANVSWDAESGVPFPAWASVRAHGAVIDELRRWYGRGVEHYHDDPLSLDLEGAGHLDFAAPGSPEQIVVDCDTARRALDALDGADAESSATGKGPTRHSPSSRAVLLGSAAGLSQVEMAGGACDYTRISQILRAGRAVITEVMAS